jgi:hypothetical protein
MIDALPPQPPPPPPPPAIVYKCVRWTWTGDVYNRIVTCLEWVKK